MKWLNILGLILQFLSFWLAAPELLGAATLKRFESGLIKIASRVPSIALGIIGLIFGIGMATYGTYTGMNAAEGDSGDPFQTMMIILAISIAYMIYVFIFYKRIQRFLERVFAKPMINMLITNNESRKVSLIIGAVLFTIGFLCQLTALVLS